MLHCLRKLFNLKERENVEIRYELCQRPMAKFGRWIIEADTKVTLATFIYSGERDRETLARFRRYILSLDFGPSDFHLTKINILHSRYMHLKAQTIKELLLKNIYIKNKFATFYFFF